MSDSLFFGLVFKKKLHKTKNSTETFERNTAVYPLSWLTFDIKFKLMTSL